MKQLYIFFILTAALNTQAAVEWNTNTSKAIVYAQNLLNKDHGITDRTYFSDRYGIIHVKSGSTKLILNTDNIKKMLGEDAEAYTTFTNKHEHTSDIKFDPKQHDVALGNIHHYLALLEQHKKETSIWHMLGKMFSWGTGNQLTPETK